MKVSGILAILFATTAFAQTTAPKPVDQPKTDVVIKDTPASQALIQFSKDKTADQAVFDTKIKQAQFTLDQSNKDLQTQIDTANKDLLEKLKADKKYKPLLDNLDNLNAKKNDNGQRISGDFQKDTGALQKKLTIDADEVAALTPVVRQENDLPDTATFNESTGKWTVPEKK